MVATDRVLARAGPAGLVDAADGAVHAGPRDGHALHIAGPALADDLGSSLGVFEGEIGLGVDAHVSLPR